MLKIIRINYAIEISIGCCFLLASFILEKETYGHTANHELVRDALHQPCVI